MNYLSTIHLTSVVITIGFYAEEHELDPAEMLVLILYYFLCILILTIVCAMLGYWMELGERTEFKILKEAEAEFTKS
jgi:hypothetical protein